MTVDADKKDLLGKEVWVKGKVKRLDIGNSDGFEVEVSFNTEATAWVTPKRDELIVIIPKFKFGDKVMVNLDGYDYVDRTLEGIVMDDTSDKDGVTGDYKVRVTVKDNDGDVFTDWFNPEDLYLWNEKTRMYEE